MCGICGTVHFDNSPIQEQNLRLMMLKMKHRGPDDEGVFADNNIGFGFVRLSIIDLSEAGHQPMTDISQRYTIVFNGEIFNYIELREELKTMGVRFRTQTDTEVLLAMYTQFGADCLHKLNGMFAFAIYDKVTQQIFAARDRFGVKPFYYYQTENSFYFASEIPSLLAVAKKKFSANEKVITDYLTFNRTDQTNETFFNGIYKLQHGSYLTIKGTEIRIGKWYDLRSRITKLKGNKETFRKLLIDAVKLRLRSDVPVGVCLSGGLDSSAITSIIARELHRPDVHTFSAIFNSDSKVDESKFINLYKQELSNMHFVVPDSDRLLENMTHFIQVHAEPIPTTSPFAQYCVMQLAQNQVTVTLDGQGADEHLGGYHYFFGFYFKDLFKHLKWVKLTKEMIRYCQIHKSIYAFKTFVYFLLPSGLKSKTSMNKMHCLHADFIKNNESNQSKIVHELYASKSLHEALLNHFEYKLEHLLKWNDRNSMAFSIESRTPFLDYRLVEYSLSMEPNQIIRDGVTKYMLRESMKGILPEEIRTRQDKIGFETPQDEWFRTDKFQKIINEILLSESFKNRKIIDVERAQKLYAKHIKGELNISKEIWKWIHLELWFRKFID